MENQNLTQRRNVSARSRRRRRRRRNTIGNILSICLAVVLMAIYIMTGFKMLAKEEKPSETAPTQPPETSIPETTAAPAETLPAFTDAPEGYFQDALFIGDSRTVGLYEYGGIDGADFFATTGMSVYNIGEEKVQLDGTGSITFDDLLESRTYGKIYVMLGINELGYDREATVQRYFALIDQIRQAQPQAILFVEANMHVSAQRSSEDNIYNNENINALNERFQTLADNENIFYLDVNELFDDENGNLKAECTYDDTHVLGKYYKVWADWLATKAVLR